GRGKAAFNIDYTRATIQHSNPVRMSHISEHGMLYWFLRSFQHKLILRQELAAAFDIRATFLVLHPVIGGVAAASAPPSILDLLPLCQQRDRRLYQPAPAQVLRLEP